MNMIMSRLIYSESKLKIQDFHGDHNILSCTCHAPFFNLGRVRYKTALVKRLNVWMFAYFPFQFIIFASWAFAFILQIPQFLNKEFNREINPHFCINAWREKWITRTFFLVWLAFYVIFSALMAVLYYKIIRALWFKRDGDNNATHQQQV